jgi:hypothetical protein
VFATVRGVCKYNATVAPGASIDNDVEEKDDDDDHVDIFDMDMVASADATAAAQ